MFVQKENTIGLKQIMHSVEDNYLIKSKWSYIVDIQGYALKYYLRPSSTVIDVGEDGFGKGGEEVREKVVECM